jgi:hypothetical protein
MFGLSRLVELAGKITWQLNERGDRRRPARRRPIRRAALALEELEGRIAPALLGQQIFPTDYPWNQNISSAPVAANSAAIIAHIGGSIGIHPDWGADSPSAGTSPLYGIPYNVVHGNSTAKVNVVIDNYPGESDILAVPMPANPVIEGDYQGGPNPNGGGYNPGQRGDSHLIVWDEDNNIAYEFYGATRPSDPTLFPNTSGVELPHTDGRWHAAQESVWHMSADSFRPLGNTSADAAGLSILAGLARPDEGLPAGLGGQGAINHALRFTLPSGDVNPQYIYPASHVVGTSAGSTKLPFGARLRLMNTPAVNAVIATLGPEAQIVARAMQQYGLVLADIGSAMYVSGASGSVDANNNLSLVWNMSDVLGLHSLTASDFQVVDLTPVVTGLSASSGLSGSTVTVIGQNFSGAAGHLAVFFGSTAATSVTYVDDSHLTAVVPFGSGTVHVQVQSGVNAIDPNNPNDNVNNPIFGYGTSALSPADQFTYLNQPISGTNSTDSFASPTVASGNTDLLTIVVKDTSGNPVAGLPGSLFSFAFSGGTSAGTLGPVTATATPGTYTATFTGTTAGTASTLAVTVGGVTFATRPTVTVTATDRSVVATFASGGLWRWTAAGGWTEIHPSTPPSFAVDAAGDVTATFAGAGLWRWTATGGWAQIDTYTPQSIAVDAAGDVVGVFAGSGIWRWVAATGTWSQIHPSTPPNVAVDAAGDVAATFAGAGLWRWTAAGGWAQIDTYTPQSIAVDAAGDVVGVFAGSGIWRWVAATGTWSQIHPSTPQNFAVDAAGDVLATFAGAGLWRWTAAGGWVQIDPYSPQIVVADAAGDVVAGFGGAGLWRWTLAAGWQELTSGLALSIAVNAT